VTEIKGDSCNNIKNKEVEDKSPRHAQNFSFFLSPYSLLSLSLSLLIFSLNLHLF